MEITQIFRSGLIRLGFMCLLLLFQSCVDEDILDLPPQDDQEQLSESSAIISLLRGVQREQLSEFSECFTLFYPIKLGYNNDLTITIESFEALNEVANSQTSGQHIDKVEFPILISKLGTVNSISNNDELLEILEDCQIPTLRDEFDLFHTQCLRLEYPIEMIDVNQNTVTISSEDEYFEFEAEQGFDKQPIFIYPLTVFKYSEDRNISIESDFDFYRVFDECNKCPSLFFETDFQGGTEYQFTATFPEKNQIRYDWFVDNVKIEEDGGPQGDNVFFESFDPGTYEICIKTRLEDNDCFAGTSYCELITVEDPCPTIFFESEPINDRTYLFTADFPLNDEIEYVWVIFQNGDSIFSQIENEEGDDQLEFQFEPGIYDVCIETEVSGCDQLVKYCEEITID